MLIGRGSDCDVTLPYRGVSVHHALLRYRPVTFWVFVGPKSQFELSSHQTIEKQVPWQLQYPQIYPQNIQPCRPLGDSEPLMHLEDTSTNGTGMASGADWLPIRKGQARALKSHAKFVVPFNRKPHQEAVPGNLSKWKFLIEVDDDVYLGHHLAHHLGMGNCARSIPKS